MKSKKTIKIGMLYLIVIACEVAMGCITTKEKLVTSNVTSNQYVLSNSSSINLDENTVQTNTRNQNIENYEKTIWSGIVEGVKLRWTTKDFYVDSNRESRKILSDYSQQWFNKVSKDQSGGINTIEFKVLSIVGSLVSIEVSESITSKNAANIASRVSWIVLDLSKSGEIALSYSENTKTVNKNASLTDYFSENDILHSLLENQYVNESVTRKSAKSPQTLEKLFEIENLFVKDQSTLLTEYSLNKFVFKNIKNEKVIIALELLDSYNPRLGEVPSIDIQIPISQNLKTQLSNANTLNEGFLLKDQPKISNNQTTSFTYMTP